MRGNIIIVAAFAALLAGCTTDGTETSTEEIKPAKKTINYTAWACEGSSKTVSGYRCSNFHASYGPARSEAVKHVQKTCPGNCKILVVKPGCASLTLDSGKVLRPKC